jgi:hypothetical protein
MVAVAAMAAPAEIAERRRPHRAVDLGRAGELLRIPGGGQGDSDERR